MGTCPAFLRKGASALPSVWGRTPVTGRLYPKLYTTTQILTPPIFLGFLDLIHRAVWFRVRSVTA
jgi:hypothetical protein